MPASKAAWHKHRDDKNSTPENWKAFAMSQQSMKVEAFYIQTHFLSRAIVLTSKFCQWNFHMF